MQRLYINEAYANLLKDERLDSYDALRHSDIAGTIMDEDRHRSVRRIVLAGQYFYLKRVYKPKLNSAIEALLRVSVPHHYCWREMQHVHYLQDAGFAVMEVAAAGESGRWGVPDSSFVLVREVEGRPLDKVFEQASEAVRHEVLDSLGKLAGKLHRKGFFAPVRMKDVFQNKQDELILIDRETRNPKPGKFSSRKAVKSLTKTLSRQSRDDLQWSAEQMKVYLEAYLGITYSCWSIAIEELSQKINTSSATNTAKPSINL